MTPSEIQKKAVAERWHKEEVAFPLPAIDSDKHFFPHLYECKLYPGYVYIPWVSSRVVVNVHGKMIKLLTGEFHKRSQDAKGYWITALRTGDTFKNYRVHRIVAMLFCEKPEHLKDIPFEELEVNHKNGDKNNNHKDNLEWVTTAENMQHAWNSGFIKTEIPVLAKTLDGDVIRYPSISECARQHGVKSSQLSIHVNSPWAGMIIVDECVFKLDNGLPWPDYQAYKSPFLTLNMSCDCVAENKTTNQKYLFSSVADACRNLNLSITAVRLSRTRKGFDVPYKGWIFYSFTGVPLSRKLKGA